MVCSNNKVLWVVGLMGLLSPVGIFSLKAEDLCWWQATKEVSAIAWEAAKAEAPVYWKATKEKSAEAWQVTKEQAPVYWEATKVKSAEAWETTKEKTPVYWDVTKEISADAWGLAKQKAPVYWEATQEKSSDAWDAVCEFNWNRRIDMTTSQAIELRDWGAEAYSSFETQVYVDSYTRGDGTFVSSHWRSQPGSAGRAEDFGNTIAFLGVFFDWLSD